MANFLKAIFRSANWFISYELGIYVYVYNYIFKFLILTLKCIYWLVNRF